VLFLPLISIGCATTSDQEPLILPEGHPPVVSNAAPAFRDAQAEAYASYMYGLILADEGKNKEAIASLQMASKLDPGSPEILDQLMRMFMGEGKRSEAEQTAEKILLLDPQWTDAHVFLGQIMLETDRPIEAVSHFEIALELAPEKTNIIFLLADALEITGNIEGAIALIEELMGSEDHQGIAHYYAARLRLRSGDIETALDDLTKAIEFNPSFLKGVGELGGQLESGGQTEEAIRFYTGYLERDPGKTPVRELLTRILIREERYEEARQQISIVLEENPENSGALLLMGLIEAHDGKYDKALEIFTEVRRMAPDNFDMVLQIGILQRQLKMYKESIATFQDASLLAPNRYEPHLNLAVAYDMTDELEKALESARTALALAPENTNIRTYLAQLLMRKSSYSKAEEILRHGLEKTPNDTVTLYQLAIVYDRSDRFTLAIDLLKRIIEIDPGHHDALNYLGYSWADRGVNLEESLVLIKKALKIRPDAAYIMDSLGWVYYRMGRYEEALEQLLKAGKEMEGDSTVLEHLGDTYDKLGQTDLAIEFWSLTLKADPGNVDVLEKLRKKGAIESAP